MCSFAHARVIPLDTCTRNSQVSRPGRLELHDIASLRGHDDDLAQAYPAAVYPLARDASQLVAVPDSATKTDCLLVLSALGGVSFLTFSAGALEPAVWPVPLPTLPGGALEGVPVGRPRASRLLLASASGDGRVCALVALSLFNGFIHLLKFDGLGPAGPSCTVVAHAFRPQARSLCFHRLDTLTSRHNTQRWLTVNNTGSLSLPTPFPAQSVPSLPPWAGTDTPRVLDLCFLPQRISADTGVDIGDFNGDLILGVLWEAFRPGTLTRAVCLVRI